MKMFAVWTKSVKTYDAESKKYVTVIRDDLSTKELKEFVFGQKNRQGLFLFSSEKEARRHMERLYGWEDQFVVIEFDLFERAVLH